VVIGIASMAAACDARALHFVHRTSTLMHMDLRPFSLVAGHGVCRQEIDLRLGAAFSRFQTLTLAKGCEELSNKVVAWLPLFIFIHLPLSHLSLGSSTQVTSRRFRVYSQLAAHHPAERPMIEYVRQEVVLT
jgi:hypothetical protein